MVTNKRNNKIDLSAKILCLLCLYLFSGCSQSNVKTVFSVENYDWSSVQKISFMNDAETYAISKGYKCWSGTWEETASIGCIGNQNILTIFTIAGESGIIVSTDQVLFAFTPTNRIDAPKYHIDGVAGILDFFGAYQELSIYREYDFGRREDLFVDDIRDFQKN